MCDFFSWIKTRDSDKPFFLTDDMILAKWGPDVNFSDKIGHFAICSYFDSSLLSTHHESIVKVPPAIAREINAGHCRRMLAGSDYPFKSLRYNSSGRLIEVDGSPVKTLVKANAIIFPDTPERIAYGTWTYIPSRAAWDSIVSALSAVPGLTWRSGSSPEEFTPCPCDTVGFHPDVGLTQGWSTSAVKGSYVPYKRFAAALKARYFTPKE